MPSPAPSSRSMVESRLLASSDSRLSASFDSRLSAVPRRVTTRSELLKFLKFQLIADDQNTCLDGHVAAFAILADISKVEGLGDRHGH